MHALPVFPAEAARGAADLAPRLRAMIADHLGVDVDDVLPDTSFADDLAADSLDLVELGIAIESELGVPLPDVALQQVRTFRELVRLAAARRCAGGPTGRATALLHARLVPAGGAPGLERVFRLDPYELEKLRDDVRRAGPGARVEVSVPAETAADILSWVRRRIAGPAFRPPTGGATVPGRRARRS